jgi:hypothetical protein
MPKFELTERKSMADLQEDESRKSVLQQLRWPKPLLGDFAFVHSGVAVCCHL